MAILAQLVDDVVVHKFELEKSSISMGRHPDNDIVIDDTAVSSTHLVILHQPNEHFPEYREFYLEDKGSTNGSFVNDLSVKGTQRLHHNDVIRLAWNKFKFMDDKEASMEKTMHMLNKTL
ncbi:FHA domain-containing protein [Teredinibacter haidensis]|uniref:FHA domain-containing protein n=1 Tax=Teredinibacter haidensis TaxID=2731755 RepID=UPI000948B8C6|nr:FHA domain-containing protein [Teredinibacter haidensis]